MENLTDIAIFIQVVDSGSFTAAADKLDMSKSVISKYVTRLEERLAVRLLHRTTRKLNLTEAGKIFYERSKHGLEEIESAENEISILQREPKGTLRLNTPMSFGILHVAPALKEFQDQYPDVTIDMRLEDQQVNLVEEGYDLAIRIAELPDSTLVAKRLGPCRHVICASPEYLEKYGTPHVPDDLQPHKTLTYGYHESPREWKLLSKDNRYVSVPVTSCMHINNSLALRKAVLEGAGIVLIPTFIVGSDIKKGRLISLLTDYRMLEISIYAVYPQRRYLSPKVRAFVEFMSERISNTPYWDYS